MGAVAVAWLSVVFFGAGAELGHVPGPAPVPERGAHGPLDGSVHVALGIPVDGTPADDVLIDHGVYVLSYSAERRVANWVSWELEAAQLGNTGRAGDFVPDDLLPAGLYRVAKSDYARSGYERGHLCPSADRTSERADNLRTFFMSNVHPQTHALNGGPWEKLERLERELARNPGARLYIVAGGVFDRNPVTIGPGIAVPRLSFKAIVPLRAGQTAADVTPATDVIAVMMPNDATAADHPWPHYLTTVDAIERATGYDLFPRIPDPIEQVIEARIATLRQ
jgi:endonuclease G